MSECDAGMGSEVQVQIGGLNATAPEYPTRLLGLLLDAAVAQGASDIHLQPVPEGLDVRWRLDGVLQPVGCFARGTAADVVTRLKVMAELLTYRTDVPQEGRLRRDSHDVEMRVSTFPTLHGERAVVRLFATRRHFLHIADLGLPHDVAEPLARLLDETSGALLITGPAGSGKTTTMYAGLREIVRRTGGGRSVVSLEDPVEVAVEGVAQSQTHASAGYDMRTGLRSLMRQDPEVIMVGEIRDPETAETVFQAALTGHLVLTSFHAGSAAGAISRLSDMGIEPYLLRSGLLGILSQRLVRRLCTCAEPVADFSDAQRLGLPVRGGRLPVGCSQCHNTGFHGRMVLAELLHVADGPLGRAVLERREVGRLEQLAVEQGMVTRWQRAVEAIERGWTTPDEVRRVMGFSGGQFSRGNGDTSG